MLEHVEAGNGCTAADNVVGVSHLISRRRFGELLGAIDGYVTARLEASGAFGRPILQLPISHRMSDYAPANGNWSGLEPDGPEAA
jgi:hypothetical protein